MLLIGLERHAKTALIPGGTGIVVDPPDGRLPPLTAEAVISELPAPVEPIVALPPEKVGTRATCELKPGAIVLGTKVKAITCRAELSQPLMANDSSTNADHFSNPKRNARF